MAWKRSRVRIPYAPPFFIRDFIILKSIAKVGSGMNNDPSGSQQDQTDYSDPYQPQPLNMSQQPPVYSPYNNTVPSLPTEMGYNGSPTGFKKKKKLGLIVAIIVASALVIIGGGGALAYNMWYQNPNKVIGDALVNALVAENMVSAVSINSQFEDFSLKLTADAQLSTGMNGFAVDVEFSSQEESATFKGAGLVDEKGDLYFKIDNIQDALGSVSQGSSSIFESDSFKNVITKIDGNWIKIAKDELKGFSEDYANSTACFAELDKSLATNTDWTIELYKLYGANPFLIIDDNLEDKSVNGVDSLGYELNIDHEKAAIFASGIEATEFGKKLKECEEDIDFTELADSIKERAESNTDESSEKNYTRVWVSRFGHEITELQYGYTDEESTGEIVLNPKFNDKITMAIPNESLEYSVVIEEIQAAYLDYFMGGFADDSVFMVDPNL